MIEILFYLSLAATLFLLFLLINHLKTRIVTLETQNEGLMDIIKLLRGNMVTSDNQQKNLNERLVYLERKSSNSSVIGGNPENITLEISPVRNVDMLNGRNKKIEISDEEDEYVLPVYDLRPSEDDYDSGEEDDSGEENEEVEGHLETIDIPYPTDISGFIEIQKMNYDDEEEEEYQREEHEALDIREILELQGNGMTDLQKMMLMMSFGKGFPGFSSGFGESEMEFLEDGEDYSDLPDLVEDDDVVSDVVSDVVTDVVSDVVTEVVSDVVSDVVTDVVSELPETEPIDYHKMDIKTLRQMAQDLHIKENVKNMKKPEIIKLLSSQAKV